MVHAIPPRQALSDLIENARDAMQRLRENGFDVTPEKELITALVKAQERYYTATSKR